MTPPPVALVAGAGGIGAEIATRLAADGHTVGVTDVDPSALDALDGRVAQAVTGDATEPDDVDRVVGAVEEALGPIGVLVNALGAYGPRRTFLDSEPEAWWRVLEVNLRGPALLARRVVPGMVDRRGGHVVNLASRAATWDDPGGSSVAYSTSKAALRRFTTALAAELAGTGVVVVDLSPGFVRTGLTADRPGIDDLPETAFVPPGRAAAHAAALVSGRYDALHGRFVHVEDDLDALLVAEGGGVSFDHPVEQVGPGTPAGTVLRRYWQPVAVAHDLVPGATLAVRVLGEDLTLFRSEAGPVHAVGPRCPHRGIALHHGSVEGDRLRCFYHGWCFDGAGHCVERPAERSDRDPAADLPTWPVEEYADLVWVHLGGDDPPPLPRYPELDVPGIVPVGDIRPPGPWPINWFQAVENHVDPVHLSFVHRVTEPYAREVPEVSVERTADGLAVTAVRSGGPRTTHLHFPSCIQVPMRHIVDDVTELQFFNWAVPVDDHHTAFVATTAVPEALVDSVRADLAGRSMDPDAGPALLDGRRRPASVTEEDYVALVGQGTVVDRQAEHLGRSDVAVIALRRLWQEALAGSGALDDE